MSKVNYLLTMWFVVCLLDANLAFEKGNKTEQSAFQFSVGIGCSNVGPPRVMSVSSRLAVVWNIELEEDVVENETLRLRLRQLITTPLSSEVSPLYLNSQKS